MVQKKLECAEVISMKEPIQSLDTSGSLVFVITQSHGMKVRTTMISTTVLLQKKNISYVTLVGHTSICILPLIQKAH